jgi:hypothetical protein
VLSEALYARRERKVTAVYGTPGNAEQAITEHVLAEIEEEPDV